MDRQLGSVSLLSGRMFSEFYHKEQPVGGEHISVISLESREFLERASDGRFVYFLG